jgi:transposase
MGAAVRSRQRVAKSLSVRTHVCPSCGVVLDRDENAALNSLRAGQARQAPTQPIGGIRSLRSPAR